MLPCPLLSSELRAFSAFMPFLHLQYTVYETFAFLYETIENGDGWYLLTHMQDWDS